MIRAWTKWCISHRMKWAVFAVMILSLPIYFAVGAWIGCKEVLGDFASDWKQIKRAEGGEE